MIIGWNPIKFRKEIRNLIWKFEFDSGLLSADFKTRIWKWHGNIFATITFQLIVFKYRRYFNRSACLSVFCLFYNTKKNRFCDYLKLRYFLWRVVSGLQKNNLNHLDWNLDNTINLLWISLWGNNCPIPLALPKHPIVVHEKTLFLDKWVSNCNFLSHHEQ